MSHPPYVQDMIRESCANGLRERLVDLREAAVDCTSYAIHAGDKKAIRYLNDIFLALNQLEATE